MGNDPVNQIDPSGGIAIPPCPGTGQLAIFFAKAGAKVGNIVSAISSISRLASISINVAKVGTEIFNKSVQTKIIDRQLLGNATLQVGAGNSLGQEDGSGDDDDWKDLYKSDLKTYYKQTYGQDGSENDLGTEFEDLFAEFAENDPSMRASNVRKNIEKLTGGFRNTVPDFVGDAEVESVNDDGVINITTIKGADWYELKQQNGSLTLSSNEDQIAGHIDNIRRKTDYAYQKYRSAGYQSKLIVVTTADVKFSESIDERATKNNVIYELRHAEYRIRNRKWEFRFTKIIDANYRL